MDFRVLGPIEVWSGEERLALSGRKQLGLLALLLLQANRVVPSGRLLEELWPGEPRDRAAAALRVRVHHLRRALGSAVVESRAPGYRIRIDRGQLDLLRFETLVEEGHQALAAGAVADARRKLADALSLWRGPALAEVGDEAFALGPIARLEEMRHLALELRVEADLELGRDAELVGELRSLVAEHPLRERAQGHLMLALYRAGRQAEALEVYRSAREAMADELGLEPAESLRALERAILHQDPALDAASPRALAASGVAPSRRIVAVTMLGAARLGQLLQLAVPLARSPERELIVAELVADVAQLATSSRELREHCGKLVAGGVVARAAVFTSEQPGEDVVRLATEQDAALLLVDASPDVLADGIPGPQLAMILAEAPCDVALLAGGSDVGDGAVLVPFGGAEYDWAAVELGAWIARERGVPLRLLGASGAPELGKRDASRLLASASLVVERGLGLAAEPVIAAPGPAGLLAATGDGVGVVVAGLSPRWHREGLGETRLALAREALPPVLLVRRGLRPGGLAPPAAATRYTWSVRLGA